VKLPVAPNRELGQHFLVDDNILGVAGRLAELGPQDVVLEVGAGLGVLTAYLAERVCLVHAVELDRSLEPHLRDAVAGHDNVELVLGDAEVEAARLDVEHDLVAVRDERDRAGRGVLEERQPADHEQPVAPGGEERENGRLVRRPLRAD